MFEGKPIIGIAGGIGSGKTFVAKLFGELGCLVINSDEMVHQAYKNPTVKHTLHHWWGTMVFDAKGEIDRPTVARKIFNSQSERTRLERLIHPIVNETREKMMKSAANDPAIKAYIFDTPLLFETELNRLCDAVVFVDTPREVRLQRVRGRGWDEQELARRENSQMPLDRKAQISHYSVANAAETESGTEPLRDQVRKVLSQILDQKG